MTTGYEFESSLPIADAKDSDFNSEVHYILPLFIRKQKQSYLYDVHWQN